MNIIYYLKRLFRIKPRWQKDEEKRKSMIKPTNDLLDMLKSLPDYALHDISERYR